MQARNGDDLFVSTTVKPPTLAPVPSRKHEASASAVEERWLQELRKVVRHNTSVGLPWHCMVLPDPLAQTAGAFCAFERQQGGNKNVMLTKNQNSPAVYSIPILCAEL